MAPATTAVVPYPDTLAIATKPGRVFVASSVTPSGRMDVLDAGTGRLLRTVAVSRGSHALAVNERSGHVFVANSYGTPAGDGSMSRLVAWGRSWLPAWGHRWLSRLALPSHPSRVVADSVSVLDVAQ
jgi:DNA-binding beta-propeller fold protein YncE